jgi:hypothetical protein
MSRLAETTEKAAIAVIQRMLPCFGQLDSLGMSAQDAFDARAAENLLRGIVESSPHFEEPKI